MHVQETSSAAVAAPPRAVVRYGQNHNAIDNERCIGFPFRDAQMSWTSLVGWLCRVLILASPSYLANDRLNSSSLSTQNQGQVVDDDDNDSGCDACDELDRCVPLASHQPGACNLSSFSEQPTAHCGPGRHLARGPGYASNSYFSRSICGASTLAS